MADVPLEPTDEQLAVIVDEAVAACAGVPSTRTDHPRQVRRVRAVIAAIEGARQP